MTLINLPKNCLTEVVYRALVSDKAIDFKRMTLLASVSKVFRDTLYCDNLWQKMAKIVAIPIDRALLRATPPSSARDQVKAEFLHIDALAKKIDPKACKRTAATYPLKDTWKPYTDAYIGLTIIKNNPKELDAELFNSISLALISGTEEESKKALRSILTQIILCLEDYYRTYKSISGDHTTFFVEKKEKYPCGEIIATVRADHELYQRHRLQIHLFTSLLAFCLAQKKKELAHEALEVISESPKAAELIALDCNPFFEVNPTFTKDLKWDFRSTNDYLNERVGVLKYAMDKLTSVTEESFCEEDSTDDSYRKLVLKVMAYLLQKNPLLISIPVYVNYMKASLPPETYDALCYFYEQHEEMYRKAISQKSTSEIVKREPIEASKLT